MNSLEKDNIVDKAICCSGTLAKQVADMYLNGHPCADKEFQKLFLLTSYIETLGCYQADVETTTYTVVAGTSALSIWSMVIPCSIWEDVSSSGVEISLVVDGNTQSVMGDDVSTYGELITELITDLEFTCSPSACVDTNITVTITAACDTESIVATVIEVVPSPDGIDYTYTAVQTQAGNCSGDTLSSSTTTTTYTNCLTEDQADDIATQISKLCNLCDEH